MWGHAERAKQVFILVFLSITLARLYIFVQTLQAGKEYGKILGSFSDCGTQCKNIHQEFMKCTHTISGICEIFKVKKLKVTLFSTTWSPVSVFICIKYISISRSIQVIHCKELMSSPTLLVLRRDKKEFEQELWLFLRSIQCWLWHYNRLYGALYRILWMKCIPKLIHLFW